MFLLQWYVYAEVYDVEYQSGQKVTKCVKDLSDVDYIENFQQIKHS